MEAPERIYLERIYLNHGVLPNGINFNETPNDIEYVRKDAFIEKALAYLNEKFYFNNLHYAVENNTFNCMEEMYDDFRKYMEE